jgi:hypothetical protein
VATPSVRRLHPDRTCNDCTNALHGIGGVYCRFFGEDVFDERIAVECPEFEPFPTGPVVIIA